MNKADAIKILNHPQVADGVDVRSILSVQYEHIHEAMINGDRLEMYSEQHSEWVDVVSSRFHSKLIHPPYVRPKQAKRYKVGDV